MKSGRPLKKKLCKPVVMRGFQLDEDERWMWLNSVTQMSQHLSLSSMLSNLEPHIVRHGGESEARGLITNEKREPYIYICINVINCVFTTHLVQ